MAVEILDDQRTTANVNSIRRFIDLDRTIERLDVGDIPLVILLDQLRRKPANDSLVQWLEDQHVPEVTTVDGAHNNSTTTINVATDTGKYARANDLIYVTTTGEVMLVTVAAASALTVATRPWAGSATAITDGDEILILGTAMPEGSRAPEVRSTKSVTQTNFVQNFKWAYSLSDEWGNDVSQMAEDDKAYQREKALEEFFKRVELALFFGKAAQDVSDVDNPRRSMGGMNEYITTNVLDVSTSGGLLTEPDLIKNFIEPIMKKGSLEKWLFAAPRIHTVISGFAAGKLETRHTDTTFGIKIETYKTSHGVLNLINHRLFSRFAEGAKMGFALDMNKIWLRVMANVTRMENIQENDEDRIKEQYKGKFSAQVDNDEAHGKLLGVEG